MSVSDFYVFLPSDMSKLPGERNTLSHYRTRLPVPIDLGGSWEVALVELMYTKSWLNFPVKDTITFSRYELNPVTQKYWQPTAEAIAVAEASKDQVAIAEAKKAAAAEVRSMDIPEANYTVDELFTEIETRLKEINFGVNITPPRITYDKSRNLCKIKPGIHGSNVHTRIIPKIGPILAGILGIDEVRSVFVKKLVLDTKYVGEREVDLEGGRRSIFVYTDIVLPQVVGNTLAPLLRVLPINQHTPLGTHVYHSFNNLYYFPLSKNFINSVEIRLCDITGDYVPFRSGRVVSTLHFRQKP